MADPKIVIEVSKVDEPPAPDFSDIAKRRWGARVSEVDFGTQGSQVVWAFDDDSGGRAVKGDLLTDEQLDFLVDCEDGKIGCWRVEVTIEHPEDGTLLADDSFLVWGEEPSPKNKDLANRAFGTYTSTAADAMAWFEKVRALTPSQADLVALYQQFRTRLPMS